jgi:hypothetical protein
MMSGGNSTSSDDWKDFDFSAVRVEGPRATRALPKREVMRFVTVGFLSGIAAWLMRLAVDSWIMGPIFCKTPDTASVCTNAGVISFVIALSVVGIIAITVLVSARVFRAMIITAATFVSLGALWPLLNTRGTVIATILTAVFATGLYLFFALIAAVKRYALAVILMATLVVAFWLLARV